MNMNGEQRIAAPRQKVWEALNDPQVLRASIPGCQSLEQEAGDRFNAVVEVKVGPIGARFKGTVTLTELNPPSSYTLNLEGNGGIAGSAKGSARVKLSDDGDGTLVSYTVDAQVGGRMAQLGGSMIDATAKQLAGKFFSRFGEIVCGIEPSPPTTARTAPAASAAASVAAVASGSGFPIAWILTTVVAALAGFLLGRSQGIDGPDWAGLAMGLLVIVVAAAAFAHGRHSASQIVVLDKASLRRLLDGDGT